MIKAVANVGGKKAVSLKGFGEHADVLKVNDADTLGLTNVCHVAEEVVLTDIGMTDGEIIRQKGRRRHFL